MVTDARLENLVCLLKCIFTNIFAFDSKEYSNSYIFTPYIFHAKLLIIYIATLFKKYFKYITYMTCSLFLIFNSVMFQ